TDIRGGRKRKDFSYVLLIDRQAFCLVSVCWSPYLNNSEVQANISHILLSHTPPTSPFDWDLCKQEISTYYCSISTSFSKKTRSAIINLSNRIVKLQNSPHPNNTKIIHLKKALSKLQHKQTISLAIRSRVCWFEQGEKSSAYFFSQYKQHQQNINIDE